MVSVDSAGYASAASLLVPFPSTKRFCLSSLAFDPVSLAFGWLSELWSVHVQAELAIQRPQYFWPDHHLQWSFLLLALLPVLLLPVLHHLTEVMKFKGCRSRSIFVDRFEQISVFLSMACIPCETCPEPIPRLLRAVSSSSFRRGRTKRT